MYDQMEMTYVIKAKNVSVGKICIIPVLFCIIICYMSGHMLENTSGLDFEIDKLCMYFGCYGNEIRCYGCIFTSP